MADDTALTPHEAALVANNVYYTLGGWSAFREAERQGVEESQRPAPTRDMEGFDTVKEEVTGSGVQSLKKAGKKASLKKTFEAKTGFGTKTGFGYVLEYQSNGVRHAVIATRGTRPELGLPDLITDAYFTPTAIFMGNPIHRGFSNTFNSLRGGLTNLRALRRASHIHCVGHSLGGAVANLVAAFVKSQYQKDVKLYTFGAPRVGTHFGFPGALESALGKENIYRVSHDNDPISWIPMFPFQHVLGGDREPNNIILKSPAGPGSMKNHSMDTYTQKSENQTWSQMRGMKHLPSFEDRMMKRLWESDASGWFGQSMKGAALMGGGIVWMLMKILRAILKVNVGTFVTVTGTVFDMICRLLYWGAQQVGKLGKMVWNWIKLAAEAIGKAIKTAADVTTAVLRYILERLVANLRRSVETALQNINNLSMMMYHPAFVGPMAAATMMLI